MFKANGRQMAHVLLYIWASRTVPHTAAHRTTVFIIFTMILLERKLKLRRATWNLNSYTFTSILVRLYAIRLAKIESFVEVQ